MRNKYIYIEIDKDNSVKSYSYTENLSSNFIKFESENLSIHFLNYPIFYKYNSDNKSFVYDVTLYNSFNSKHMNESEKDSEKLIILGKQTIKMMLSQSISKKKTENIGKATTQLMIENNQLKEQVKTLGQMIIKMQLNK